jgi:hypothetical protein
VAALADHPAVARVYYPGLTAHPGHDIARQQQGGFGAMQSFELTAGAAAVEPFTRALECFTLAESLGGVESLVAHPATMTHASMSADARAAAGISDSLVRLSVGTEDAIELVHDVITELDAAHAATRLLRSPGSTAQSSLSESGPRAQTDIVLLGVGSIGRELLSQLSAFDGGFRVCGLIDRSGYVFDADGIASDRLRELRELKLGGGKLAETATGVIANTRQALERISGAGLCHPILVDATAADTTDSLDPTLSRG